ncbi:MAG: HPr(Ser) kinase/phosphatase [Melioribacteraceae bacterium]|nr:HPr(Ser) kinase/phosphatase [Melioribacteraceae bacterium]MCF8265423.1 HPr(Ser) kinase/phosphatase [Melioribacteraceae bacterium]MCF8413649.1 HPr(Ser) kinase/phosphatase [Melioribacteraceae bacterium]MCF8432125.1 HPr(Ser) kinase/phosphatase [Melioribacteraceae bacterium]
MSIYNPKHITRKSSISVEYFFNFAKNSFGLELFNPDSNLTREIKDQNLNRTGIALTGFLELFPENRVQIFGNTEYRYLRNLSDEQRKNAINRIFEYDIPCIVVTDNNTPTPDMIECAKSSRIPIFTSKFSTTKISYFMSDFLDDQFAPGISIHGSFVDVYGAGMLFVGKSGIGKSEVALDLIERGHRLVADDVVLITKKGEGILIGAGTNISEHFMEIRGIGIIDIRSMFGIRAIRFQKRLEVVIELEIWDKNKEYTRTGLDDTTINVMDIEVPYVRVPIVPGKNITVISEIIALNYLLKHYGYDAAKVFQNKLTDEIKRKSKSDRSVKYFEHDFE